MRIVLMGPPGAGKGTQAKRLAETFQLDHLSSGDIFRRVRASGCDLGRKLAGYMDAGELVPDDIVVAMMADAVAGSRSAGGLMLDGFPRTVPQAEALDRQLAEISTPLDAVVVMTVGDDQIVKRITGRRSCPRCGKAYHVTFLPPKTPGKCDACGAELVQREDDTEEVVRQRLDAYKRQTEPVIRYYRDRGHARVLEVDGSGTVDEVTQAMMQALRCLGAGR